MMPENITVADLVQMKLEWKQHFPLIIQWPNAYPLTQIIKTKYPHFSNSHINRLISGGGVRVNGDKMDMDGIIFVEDEIVIQVGRREFFKVEII
jgi:tyrosyl-tRNA synthetase